MSENKKLTPKIRFKGFTEDWEQRKLDDICNRYDNLRVPVAANERIPGSTPYYGANGIQDYVKGHTHDGEFVLVAEDGANDLKNYPVQYVNGLFWANNHVHVIQAKDKIASNKYLKYAISQTNIEPLLVGGGRAKLNANVMMDIAINTPGNIEEQNTLGTFINEIDNLITLHQRKYDKLVKIKSSLLEKMFPKNSSKIPEVRFKGFTEDWEQRKLPAIANISIGLVTTMTSHYMNHGVLLIRNSDIKDNKFEFDTDPIYLDEKFASENKHRQHQIGDVITVHTGDVGTSAVITENEVNSIGFATLISRPNKEIIDSHYLSTFYNTDKHKKFAVLMSTGDGRTNYNLGDFIELIVPFPKKGEQIKIARFINNIDNLITLHQRKLDKLQNIKKSLLDKMFV